VLAVAVLEHVDLTGDVEVVHAIGDAGVEHRRACTGERPGTVQHGRDSRQAIARGRGIVDREHARAQVQFGAHRAQRVVVATRQHDVHAPAL
jgi:hypothetical protein